MGMDRERRTEPTPLRPVEFHILLSLAAGERHGYGIIQDAEARGETLDVGTLYRALARMTEQGFIKVDPFQATSVPGLFAAGDNCSPMHTLVMGCASGAMAGVMAHRSLVFG